MFEIKQFIRPLVHSQTYLMYTYKLLISYSVIISVFFFYMPPTTRSNTKQQFKNRSPECSVAIWAERDTYPVGTSKGISAGGMQSDQQMICLESLPKPPLCEKGLWESW